jgi:hypothetical protein
MNNAESIIWQADWRRMLSAANWKLFRIWRTGTERRYDAGDLDDLLGRLSGFGVKQQIVKGGGRDAVETAKSS